MKDKATKSIDGRVKTITSSPSYRQADQDIDFLNQDITRGVRLQIDYLKAESVLSEAGIEHAIVVFGSARIKDPQVAQSVVDELNKSEDSVKESENWKLSYGEALRELKYSHYYSEAQHFGRLVGESGSGPQDTRITLVTGGGPGIMEAANRGADEVGAKSVGLNISLPYEQMPNPYITPELCMRFHYFAMRKLHFVKRAKALVAFPGGFGTLDELFGLLTLVQTHKVEPVPIVLIGKSHWTKVINFEMLVLEGLVEAKDVALFTVLDSAAEAWKYIIDWYETRGDALIQNSVEE